MKKTYIAPENTVVRIKLETMIANSPVKTRNFVEDPADVNDGKVIMEGREVVNTPDAWEEW